MQTDRPYLKASKNGETQCIAWRFIQDLIQTHHKPEKHVNMFALCVHGLVIFPKSLGYIDNVVMELFNSVNKGVNPLSPTRARLGSFTPLVPTILIDTFRSLSACKKSDEGNFIDCAQLLLVWFHSHFWKSKRVSYRTCFENHAPL
ncbi:hypothetical protein GQ457_14G016910 [Hibiscus cannabinus]